MTTLISTFKNGRTGFFALLSKRMDEKGDFPALFESTQFFEESIQGGDSNASEITSAILRDFTLTRKVIKLANSAVYSGVGREITTITHAAVVLGTDAISDMALSVRFIDTLSSSAPDSEDARLELEKAILASEIARNIVAKLHMINGEQAVVCSLMHHLGRLMLAFNFPDEWSRIKEITGGELALENDAAREVIGVSIDDIAREVARDWRLPKKISNSMKKSVSGNKTSIPGSANWLIDIVNFSGEVAAKVVNKNSKYDLKKFISGYDEVLKVSGQDIAESIDLARKVMEEQRHQTMIEPSEGKPLDSQEKLTLGIDEVSEMLAQEMDFGSMIHMVLETMYVSMGFNRAVAFFLDSGEFKAQEGFGNMMPEILPQLVFPEDYEADVFHLSLANKADVFIHEIATVKDASSIPAWFKRSLPDVGAFILLPLVFNGRAVGLIYADWKMGVADLVEPDELSSMGILRDHLLKALAEKNKWGYLQEATD